jgi:hypothetical protein
MAYDVNFYANLFFRFNLILVFFPLTTNNLKIFLTGAILSEYFLKVRASKN